MGVMGIEGHGSALAQPLYLMANECQRLSCVHPVQLWGRRQVQV